MSRQSKASLGGVTLRGAAAYDWELRAGTIPVERLWRISARHAERFRELLGTPQELVIEGPRGKTLRVKHVYPLEILPGPNPHVKHLRVADRRWLWDRYVVDANFNVRFATGTNFLVNDSGLIENAVLQPELRYRKATLYPPDNPASPWTPQQVLEYVFEQIKQPISFKASSVTADTFEVQDLRLKDRGPAAVDRVLGYFAGLEVFLDYEGNAVLYRPLDNTGLDILPRLQRKQVTGADLEWVMRPEIAPEKIVVLFAREIECRFNHLESTSRGPKDTNSLIQIAPSPDATITLTTGKKVARNSLVDITTLFATWGAFGFLGEALSFSVLAKLGYAAGVLEGLYGNNPQAVFDPVAAARIRAALQSWRRLYRIDEEFMGRLEAVRAVRATVLNTETSQRAPSPAYCDYTRRIAARGFLRSPDEPNKQSGWAVECWAAAAPGAAASTLLEDGHIAPAEVRVLDPSTGVVRVEPQLDPWGHADAIMFGYPEKGFVPTITGESDANRTGDDAYAQWLAGPMRTGFELATVLTVIPSAPNDLRRFHAVEVPTVRFGLYSTGKAPPMYVQVFPEVMTARYAWSDAQGTRIVDAIKGVGAPPEDLLVNREDVEAVADAVARRETEPWLPRLAGSVDVDLDPELLLESSINSIRHGLFGGVTNTRVSAGAIRQARDIWGYLPTPTRNFILQTLVGAGWNT